MTTIKTFDEFLGKENKINESEQSLKSLKSLPGIDKVEKNGNTWKAIRYIDSLDPTAVKKNMTNLKNIVSGTYGKDCIKDDGYGTIGSKKAVWIDCE